MQMPSISFGSLISPGSRLTALDFARAAEDHGFSGLYCPSAGDCIAFCQAALSATRSIPVGTAIQPIYHRAARSLADTAAFLHEISKGRFRLGLGVSHGPVNDMYNVKSGKPLEDVRAYVSAMRAVEPDTGPLSPIVLAALRDRMVDLAIEISDGIVFANASRPVLDKQLARIPESRRRTGFFVSCIAYTVIDDDRATALKVLRKAMGLYAFLPNYRAYWREAGYGAEMDEIESAFKKGRNDSVPELLSERLLADIALYGSKSAVRERIESYLAMGVIPVLAPYSASGDPRQALEDVFGLYR